MSETVQKPWPIEIALTGGEQMPDGTMVASFVWPADRPLNVGHSVRFSLTPVFPEKGE